MFNIKINAVCVVCFLSLFTKAYSKSEEPCERVFQNLAQFKMEWSGKITDIARNVTVRQACSSVLEDAKAEIEKIDTKSCESLEVESSPHSIRDRIKSFYVARDGNEPLKMPEGPLTQVLAEMKVDTIQLFQKKCDHDRGHDFHPTSLIRK